MDAIEERTEQLKEEAYEYSRDVHSKVDSLLKDVMLEIWSMSGGNCRRG